MTESEKSKLLSCSLFAGIAEPEKLLPCLKAEEQRYEKNAILWNIGDEIHSCAIILSGSVRAESVAASGKHTLMAVHRPGSLVGDVLMATPGALSPVYVIASEPVCAYFIPYEAFVGGCGNCCRAHRQLRENLFGELADKFWQQRRRIRYLSTPSLRVRIARYLLDTCTEHHNHTVSLGGTREDFADYLCVNRSALSRELSRMKAEGLLDYSGATFQILDAVRLAEAADSHS